MKSGFKFSNLCGTVYRQGNLVYTSDGNRLISPVGNRVTVFDLVQNVSYTLPFETRRNIRRVALSPNDALLLVVDEDARGMLIHFEKRALLSTFSFGAPVAAKGRPPKPRVISNVRFSPDSKYIAVTFGSTLQLWLTPGHTKEFKPLVKVREFNEHFDTIDALTWSRDSEYVMTGSRDMTARIWRARPSPGFVPRVLGGHKTGVMGVWMVANGIVYTLARDGVVCIWHPKALTDQKEDEASAASSSESDASMSEDEEETLDENGNERVDAEGQVLPTHEHALPGSAAVVVGSQRVMLKRRQRYRLQRTQYTFHARFFCNQTSIKVTSASYNDDAKLLSVGFGDGTFGIWEMPHFSRLQMMSISKHKVSAITFNSTGDWLALASETLGQLLVWEWKSESYVLRQQGHLYDMTCLAYSQDGQYVATGGDDGKVKLWNTQSGFCFVTFHEHTAGITAIAMAKQGHVVYSASLDGTIRGFDLIRYRNFKTMTTPTPVQFTSLAVDTSGEVIAAGSRDAFEVYMWSVQTGKIIDILPGHTGPISSMAFSPTDNLLSSASWDGTVRQWSVFGRTVDAETWNHSQKEVLALAYRPDGKQVCTATLDGQLHFWNTAEGSEAFIIDGRRDIVGGRSNADITTAENSASSKYFTTIAYSADGTCVLAGGKSKYICLYDLASRMLLRRFQTSANVDFEGMLEKLNSRHLTEAGPRALLNVEEGSDLEDRQDHALPGVQAGDLSKRLVQPQMTTRCLAFAPSGDSFAAATTEGLVLYSLTAGLFFDPIDLDFDVTPDAVRDNFATGDYALALFLALRLGEQPLVDAVVRHAPTAVLVDAVPQLPLAHTARFARALVRVLDSQRLEHALRLLHGFIKTRAGDLKASRLQHAAVLRALTKAVRVQYESLADLCYGNTYGMQYILDTTADAAKRSTGVPPAIAVASADAETDDAAASSVSSDADADAETEAAGEAALLAAGFDESMLSFSVV